ncbi:hypothetical protein IG558_17190 [Vibrio cholerae]|nr:hypothetical protein [Vibrio cholerae]MCX9443479.1 hypothetical protein [Vibrio cholerae]MCX9446946.1 hypothetical protein [Vibrio cholerae]HDZ9134276.1 hypothetical protein [Vibrio cholerae]
MTEQERIEKLEKEIAELKEIIKDSDKRMRIIFQQEFQNEMDKALSMINR